MAKSQEQRDRIAAAVADTIKRPKYVSSRTYSRYSEDRKEAIDQTRWIVDLEDDTTISLSQLIALGERLGTTHISVHYVEETGDYSECTPGDPSQLEIWFDGLEPERRRPAW